MSFLPLNPVAGRVLQEPRRRLGSEQLAEDLKESWVFVLLQWTFKTGPDVHSEEFERLRLSGRRQPEIHLVRQIAEFSRLIDAPLDRLIVQRTCMITRLDHP